MNLDKYYGHHLIWLSLNISIVYHLAESVGGYVV